MKECSKLRIFYLLALIGILFFLFPSISIAQETIKVNLSKEIGAAPVSMRIFVNRQYFTKDEIEGIPSFLKRYKKYKIPTVIQQSIYEKFKSGLALKKDSLELQRFNSKFLSSMPYQNFIYAVGGLYDNKKVVIIDANFNNDLSDDRIFYFDYNREQFLNSKDVPFLYKVNKSKRVDNYIGNELFLNYMVYDGNKLKRKNLLVEVQPFYNMTPNPYEIESSKWFDYTFLLLLSEHRKGSFIYKDKLYDVLVMQESSKELFYDVVLHVTEATDTLVYNRKKVRNENFFFYPWNKFYIGEEEFKIDFDYIDGEYMILKYIGKKEKYNNKAISFQSIEIKTKKAIAFNSGDGKNRLLHFWGSWCSPCKKDFPYLTSIADKYNINILGIATEQEKDEQNLIDIIQKFDLTFPQVCDDLSLSGGNGIATNYDVNIFPTYILINSKGNIVKKSGNILEIESMLKNMELRKID